MKIYASRKESDDIDIINKIIGKDVWVLSIISACFYWVKFISKLPSSTDSNVYYSIDKISNHYAQFKYSYDANSKWILHILQNAEGSHDIVNLEYIRFIKSIEMLTTDELLEIIKDNEIQR